MAAISTGFVAFAGASTTLHESADHGASGAVTASANYAFDLVVGAIQGDATAQAELTVLTSAIEPNGRAGTKYAANVMGLIGGRLRPPLVPIDAHVRARIDAVLDSRKRSQRE
jgi:dihydrodipicolinate synthase/N-acetylneuraminate lyase